MKYPYWIHAVLTLLAIFIFLPSCGEQTKVPPAHVGKLSTESGLQEGIIQPSKIRLEGWCLKCDELILVEASDYGALEGMVVFMPKDQLNLEVDVRGVFSISSKEANVEKIFDRITADPTESDRVSIIPMTRVYNTYAKQVVRAATRAVIIKYTILQVLQNQEAIAQELAQEVTERLSTTPITITQFGFAGIQPPRVIIDANVAAKKREIEIQEEKADKLVRITRAEGDLAVAIKQKEVDLQKAMTQVLVAKKLAKGVSEAWVTQQALVVLEKLAESSNKVFFMPMEALRNPAIMIGAMINAEGDRVVITPKPEPPKLDEAVGVVE